MKLSLRFKNPKIASVGPISKELRKSIGIPDDQECIAVVWPIYDDDFTVPEILRAAADWYEKSEGK